MAPRDEFEANMGSCSAETGLEALRADKTFNGLKPICTKIRQ